MNCKLPLIICIAILPTVIINVSADSDGQCVTYSSTTIGGDSFFSFLSKKVLSKVYKGPPKPLQDPEDIEILRTICPDLAVGENPLTCCDHKQLVELKSKFGDLVGNILGTCPSCYHNYKQAFCQMTCSPKQSKFLDVVSTDSSDDGTVVSALDYHISDTFVEGLFDSCKNVYMPGSTVNVLTLLCVPYGISCTPHRLLEFAANRSPFTLNFKFHNATSAPASFKPYNGKSIPCYEKLNGKACSCRDCPKVCPVAPPYPPESEIHTPGQWTLASNWKIAGLDGMVVLAIILFVSFCLSTAAVLSYYFLWVRRRSAEEQRKPLSATGCDLGSLEEVEPLRSKHSTHLPPSENTSTTTAETPDVEFINEEKISILERVGASFESFLNRTFNKWGVICAKRPYMIILIGLMVSAAFSVGCINFAVVTDPVELWAAPDSRARIERDYYNEHFQPFFRTEQLIILPKDNSQFTVKNKTYGPVFRQQFLLQVLELQNHLASITAPFQNSTIGLKDICFRPVYPISDSCTIQSVLNYYQNDIQKLMKADYLEQFDNCAKNFLDPTCLGTFGGPVEPHMALGGYEDDVYGHAEALVITFVVRNSLDEVHRHKAEAWEKEFIDYMKSYSNENMTVSFNSERSVQDELDRNSKGDIITVLVSYVIMFIYISISLGKAKTFSRLLVDSKITLGLSGVLIVVISALASVGLFSFIGIPATLIIIEVIPFLVLAVGVDNIFILVQAFQRDERSPDETLETQIGRIVGEVGPSMLLSSVSESCCFFLGALSDMPAVRIFALYAGTALIFDFLLQISAFISLLALDAKRQEDNRLDVCFCIQTNQKQKNNTDGNDGLMYTVFKNFYAPFLMKTSVRAAVMVIFAGWFCSSLAVIDKVEIGLDQELAMPEDSFVVDYITNLRKYLSVGPPVYFVMTEGYDYSNVENQNRICNTDESCDWNSMLAQIDVAAERSNRSYIAKSAYSWLDTYFSFMKGSCCKIFSSNGSYCPSNHISSDCIACPSKGSNRPESQVFNKHLPFFLNDIPTEHCASGGKAIYDSLVEMTDANGTIGATAYMSYHTVLKTSKDFYSALKWARVIADNLTDHLRQNSTNQSIRVFPYSVFYVFYEQYLTTWPDTLKSLGISVLTIFVVAFLLLGFDVMSAFVIVVTIVMILTNLFGLMYWWGIALNAVALVNLVMAVGISVEFCAHITKSFAASIQTTRVLRAKDSLTNMGSSVLSGITLTKFGGIVVLGFAKSQIFKIYYFKLYLCIVLFGAAHGLIFLPVFLSLAGPAVNKKKLMEYRGCKVMEMRMSTDNSEENIISQTSNSNECTHI